MIFSLLKYLGNILGLLKQDPEAFLQQGKDSEEIEELIRKRLLARQNKDFALADKIRDDLMEMGVVLEDTDGITNWRWK